LPDPVLIKDRDTFRLFWAPSNSEQFIATSKSTNPTDPSSWSTPIRVTTASYGSIGGISGQSLSREGETAMAQQ